MELKLDELKRLGHFKDGVFVRCPKCESTLCSICDSVDMDYVGEEHLDIWQCFNCQTGWTAYYTLTHIRTFND